MFTHPHLQTFTCTQKHACVHMHHIHRHRTYNHNTASKVNISFTEDGLTDWIPSFITFPSSSCPTSTIINQPSTLTHTHTITSTDPHTHTITSTHTHPPHTLTYTQSQAQIHTHKCDKKNQKALSFSSVFSVDPFFKIMLMVTLFPIYLGNFQFHLYTYS